MQQRLLRAFRADFLIPPQRFIVGFSGGPDSLAMALLLKQIRSAIPTSIELVHVNHHLRSDSSEDAVAAKALASSLELPLTIREIQGEVRKLHPGVGIEEAARRERYLLLLDQCERDDVVVLGHHAQDQAETILMHLMRGAGLQGAAGMARLSSIDIPWWESDDPASALRIWRPLLAEDRDELRTIPSIFNLMPIEDPSNASETYRRNALRLRIVPVMTDIEPGAIDAIGRFGQIAADEDRLLTELATEQRSKVTDEHEGLRVDRLLALDVALQRRIVHQWLRSELASRRRSNGFLQCSRLLNLETSLLLWRWGEIEWRGFSGVACDAGQDRRLKPLRVRMPVSSFRFGTLLAYDSSIRPRLSFVTTRQLVKRSRFLSRADLLSESPCGLFETS